MYYVETAATMQCDHLAVVDYFSPALTLNLRLLKHPRDVTVSIIVLCHNYGGNFGGIQSSQLLLLSGNEIKSQKARCRFWKGHP